MYEFVEVWLLLVQLSVQLPQAVMHSVVWHARTHIPHGIQLTPQTDPWGSFTDPWIRVTTLFFQFVLFLPLNRCVTQKLHTNTLLLKFYISLKSVLCHFALWLPDRAAMESKEQPGLWDLTGLALRPGRNLFIGLGSSPVYSEQTFEPCRLFLDSWKPTNTDHSIITTSWPNWNKWAGVCTYTITASSTAVGRQRHRSVLSESLTPQRRPFLRVNDPPNLLRWMCNAVKQRSRTRAFHSIWIHYFSSALFPALISSNTAIRNFTHAPCWVGIPHLKCGCVELGIRVVWRPCWRCRMGRDEEAAGLRSCLPASPRDPASVKPEHIPKYAPASPSELRPTFSGRTQQVGTSTKKCLSTCACACR